MAFTRQLQVYRTANLQQALQALRDLRDGYDLIRRTASDYDIAAVAVVRAALLIAAFGGNADSMKVAIDTLRAAERTSSDAGLGFSSAEARYYLGLALAQRALSDAPPRERQWGRSR